MDFRSLVSLHAELRHRRAQDLRADPQGDAIAGCRCLREANWGEGAAAGPAQDWSQLTTHCAILRITLLEVSATYSVPEASTAIAPGSWNRAVAPLPSR